MASIISQQLQSDQIFTPAQADLLSRVFSAEIQRVESRLNTSISSLSITILQQVSAINERTSSIDDEQRRLRERVDVVATKQDEMLDLLRQTVIPAIQQPVFQRDIETLSRDVHLLKSRFDGFHDTLGRIDERLKGGGH